MHMHPSSPLAEGAQNDSGIYTKKVKDTCQEIKNIIMSADLWFDISHMRHLTVDPSVGSVALPEKVFGWEKAINGICKY